MTEEILTEESIEAYESDCQTLYSKKSELTKYIDELVRKDKAINDINEMIERIKRKSQPQRPNTFSLQNQSNWLTYFDAAREFIQNQKELDALNTKLEGLNKERKEIEEAVRPLVPQRLYGVKIETGNRSLIVRDESVVITSYI